jgi:hypothetical protein
MFRTVPLSIIRSFSLYTQQLCMSYRFADSLQAGSWWNWVSSWYCSQAVSKPVWHISLLCVQLKTPDDRQRNCLTKFRSKIKFEKLMHLVGFTTRNYEFPIMVVMHLNVQSLWITITTPHTTAVTPNTVWSCVTGIWVIKKCPNWNYKTWPWKFARRIINSPHEDWK